jgi:hypothetical protein
MEAGIGAADLYTVSELLVQGLHECLSPRGVYVVAVGLRRQDLLPGPKKAQRNVVKAGEKFEVLRVNSLEEMALATPAISGGRLQLRTETKLYSIRAQ